MNYLISFLFSISSLAYDNDFLVMDPSRVECKVLPGTERNTWACDLFHGGRTVHEGRNVAEVEANGDCVKCETALEDAKNLGKRVRMLRGYYGNDLADWHLPGFLVVHQAEYCERRN